MSIQIPAHQAPPPDTANAFDGLRCLLAVFVLYSHTYFLGGYGAEPFSVWTKSQAILGEFSVLGFFGLSGYLVTASYTRSRGVLDYLVKRLRRVVPGLWVCLIVTAFALAPAIFYLRHGSLTAFPWIDGDQSALTFVTANLAIKVQQFTVSGVLAGGPYEGSLNGSLWSLWPEILCYLVLGALGLAGALDHNRPLLIIFIASLFTFHAARILLPDVTPPTLPTWVVLVDRVRYFLTFFVGAALWIWRRHFQPNWVATGLLLVALAALARLGGLQLLAPVFVPLALVQLGLCGTLRLHADVSYGLYIYGFPVQQLLAATALVRLPWFIFLAASLAGTVVLAWLSWHFVERPFLRRRTSAP
jgi:peptidoglycan/LPS O-acetylase OafA/YrhL